MLRFGSLGFRVQRVGFSVSVWEFGVLGLGWRFRVTFGNIHLRSL